jgi:hypothetical protein
VDAATAFVEKLGGKALRDQTKAGKPVIHVSLNGTQISDAGLKELAALQQLQTLWLSGTQVTTNGVAELQKALPKCKIAHTAK